VFLTFLAYLGGPADARRDTRWYEALNQYRKSLTHRYNFLYHVKTPPRSKDISKVRLHLRNVWFYHENGQKRDGSWWGSCKYYWTLMECTVIVSDQGLLSNSNPFTWPGSVGGQGDPHNSCRGAPGSWIS